MNLEAMGINKLHYTKLKAIRSTRNQATTNLGPIL